MFAQFFGGASAIVVGQKFLTLRPRLWGYAVLPVLAQMIVSLAFLALGIWSARQGVAWVATKMPVEGWAKLMWWAVKFGIYLSAIFLAMALSWVVASAVVFPLFEPLARRVEETLGVPREGFHPLTFFVSLRDGILISIEMFFANLLCLIAHAVPGAGNVLAPCLSFLVNAYFAGFALFEFSLSFRGYRRPAKKAWVNANLSTVMGVGSVAFFFNLIPILGAIFLAPIVVGTVIRHREISDTLRP